MIALLTGTAIEINEKSAIIDVHGVGYQVTLLGSLLVTLKIGQPVTLRIYHQVTDSNEALYGFATKEDLTFFNLLLTVPSVGPRTAMNILDIAPPSILAQAVAAKDLTLLTKVSGIGRKTAERIIVELGEKFKDLPITGVVGEINNAAMSALINMGYTKAQAREVIHTLPADVATVEEAVRFALQGK